MSVEEEFKHSNGYKKVDADPKLINQWRQELIDHHMDILYKNENEIWIHISILVDLINDDPISKQSNCAKLVEALSSMRYLPFWNTLLILKPMIEGEHCLLKIVDESSYQTLIKIIDRYIPTNVESEHDNFIQRYEHLKNSYEQIKKEHQS